MFKAIIQTSRICTTLLNYIPQRGARYETKITWKEPKKYRRYDPLCSGDTASLTVTSPEEIIAPFRNSKELQNANERMKKIFSLGYQKSKYVYEHYSKELVEKVKEHPLDDTSRAVNIAKLTAKIRHFQNIINVRPSKNRRLRNVISILIYKRKIELEKLRSEDYKKFEWLIEMLELQYKPMVDKEYREISRKTSLILLAKLKAQKIKEEKLASLKKAFDDQKVPFLEKKLENLKKIKEMEEKYSLTPSVSEEDIQNCVKKLEAVKIEIAENAKVGYLRKIHPYFLEPYYENLLQEKEKNGQLIREKMELSGNTRSSQDVSS